MAPFFLFVCSLAWLIPSASAAGFHTSTPAFVPAHRLPKAVSIGSHQKLFVGMQPPMPMGPFNASIAMTPVGTLRLPKEKKTTPAPPEQVNDVEETTVVTNDGQESGSLMGGIWAVNGVLLAGALVFSLFSTPAPVDHSATTAVNNQGTTTITVLQSKQQQQKKQQSAIDARVRQEQKDLEEQEIVTSSLSGFTM